MKIVNPVGMLAIGIVIGAAASAAAEDKWAWTPMETIVELVGGLDKNGKGHALIMDEDGRVLANCAK